MRCKRPLLGNVVVISKHFTEEAEKNDKLILWYISEVFRPLWEQYLYSCLGTIGNSFFLHLREWPEQKQRERQCGLPYDKISAVIRVNDWQCSLTILGESPGMHYLYRILCVQHLLWNFSCLDVIHTGIRQIWQAVFLWNLHFNL